MKRLRKWYSGLNIYLKLSPFFLLYLIISISFAKNEFTGDEVRYMWFANNLLNGFYSPPFPNFNLWNGPGYPIFIAPFVFLNFPLIAIKLANAVLLYLSLIISFKTFLFYASKRTSFIFTVLLGLYFPVFGDLPFILTEILTWFLISLTCYTFSKNYQQEKISLKLILIASLSIAYLAMTKVIFGYVIQIMFLISIIGILWPPIRNKAKKSTLTFLFAFIFCLPWLFYTYQITHKIFFWGNSGSMSLYTMSSPYPNELGDWKSADKLLLNQNHTHFMDSISRLNPLQKDEAYKTAVIENIKNHPKKYLSNWVANVGRLLFSYPYSNTPQNIKSYFTIIPNMFVIVFIAFSFTVGILNFKKIPFEIYLLLFFILIYLFGSSLASAYRRMFYITLPFWSLFILYIFDKFVSLKIKKDSLKNDKN